MLRWLLGGIVVLIVLSIVLPQLVGGYIRQNAKEEGSFSAGVYQRATMRALKNFCHNNIDVKSEVDGDNSEAQFETTCECFASEVFDFIPVVPEDELHDLMSKPEIEKKAQTLLRKCAKQAGLN